MTAVSISALRESNPEVLSWLQTSAPHSLFAESVLRFLLTRGYLSERQRDAVLKLIAKRTERALERVRIEETAPSVSYPKLEQVFATASETGLQKPRLTIGSYVFSPAPATGRNPGAIYVKADGVYLGKMLNGRFLLNRESDSDRTDDVLEIAADPEGAAIKHGKLTGRCAICSRKLTDDDSVSRGIGPICATKFGW